MPTLRTLALAVLGVVALTVTGCSVAADPVPDAPQYTPATTSTLPGTWIVADTYNSPDQPFLTFEHDGTWTGSDGCNGAEGTWSMTSAGVLTTTAGPTTQIYCDGEQLPFYLIDSESARFDGTDLTLVGHDGSDLVKVHKRASTEKAVARGTTVVVGLWTNTEPGRERLLRLTMNDDGTVSGNDGCNNFTTTWRFAEDGSVSFGKLAITGRTCEGVVTWLNLASSAVLDGKTMVIRSMYGAQLGTLTYLEALPGSATDPLGEAGATPVPTATPLPSALPTALHTALPSAPQTPAATPSPSAAG
ncbi:META domain-containing protein [Subtercola sp. Z020]|uniref:META domain-containing protein n=1 Tax=Subtercola sp. Z020 TaxID=2080582 RepID=UPI0011B001E9|nr:META domain-containing protein [Subtercola sp. Z020]